MRLFNFTLGVLGVLLIIGAFSSFLPLVFLGGIATGSFTFALVFPILLIILGAAMVYFGFYYHGFSGKSNNEIIIIVKWGIIYTISILIGSYITHRLLIINRFYAILLIALIVSIITQAVRSHNHGYEFKMKWFTFFFLVYTTLIWIMEEYVLPNIYFQTSFFSSLFMGFVFAAIILLIQKMKLKSRSIPWISVVLILILLVANLGSLQVPNINRIIKSSQNNSELSEDKQICPTIVYPFGNPQLVKSQEDLTPLIVAPALNSLIDKDVWRIENEIRSCYMGKWKDQYPDRYYCDDMIVSRWETSSSGTINYRWYTAVTTEWKPTLKGSSSTSYVLNSFLCESGQKVTVNKESTSFYVHVSRDGTEIRVEY